MPSPDDDECGGTTERAPSFARGVIENTVAWRLACAVARRPGCGGDGMRGSSALAGSSVVEPTSGSGMVERRPISGELDEDDDGARGGS